MPTKKETQNSKNQLSFTKSLYFCTHFKRSRISGVTPHRANPFCWQDSIPPLAETATPFPPSLLLPATINQSASLTSPRGRKEDEGEDAPVCSPRIDSWYSWDRPDRPPLMLLAKLGAVILCRTVPYPCRVLYCAVGAFLAIIEYLYERGDR